MKSKTLFSVLGLMAVVAALAARTSHAPDPLPSWNDGPAKTAILDFVAKTTTQGSPQFVPVEERIAVFDETRVGDGALSPAIISVYAAWPVRSLV